MKLQSISKSFHLIHVISLSDTKDHKMNTSENGPLGVIQCAYRLNYRPCLQGGKVTLVLGLP